MRQNTVGCRYGEAYAAEQRKVIEWAKALAARPPADMPWASTLNFKSGVAIAGHSMGGESTGINARAGEWRNSAITCDARLKAHAHARACQSDAPVEQDHSC